VGASVYVIASTWPEEGAPLGLPWWAHLLLLAAVGLEILFRVLKISFSARAIGIDLPLSVTARTVLGGDFAAAITPSRSGAEPARFLALTEARVPVAGALLVLFLELFIEMLSLAIIAIVMAVVFRESSTMMKSLTITVTLYAAGVLGAGALAYSLAKTRTSGPAPRWTRWLGLRAGGWHRVQHALGQLRFGLDSLLSANRTLMLISLAFSVVHVAFRLVVLPLVVYSYRPAESVPVGPLILWPLLLLYGAAVAPAPGGGGMVELAFKLSLGSAIPARLLAASLIWWRAYSFYIYIVLGALAMGRTAMRALNRTSKAIESTDVDDPAVGTTVRNTLEPEAPG
jgi:uncharacterized protein (TIRG00374 family)